jgi:hypothetical protein
MSNNDFLPEGYTIPSNSKYMKFQEGVNLFRFLAKPIMGREFWKTDPKDVTKRTPIRRRMDESISVSELEINPKSGKIDDAQHFWAMPVWNYKEKMVQILEIKQKGILEAIKSYVENPKWGSPLEYDITVTKSGSGMETKYLTDHDPKEPLDAEIKKAWDSTKINMEALFKGEDPFAEVESKEVKEAGEVFEG